VWQREGLKEPPEVIAATASYKAEQDVLGQFLAEQCALDEKEQVLLVALYERYRGWCEESKTFAESKPRFVQRLEERGFRLVVRRADRSRLVMGLRLCHEYAAREVLRQGRDEQRKRGKQ
jgi:phage/plasmid-associated DNA primase